MRSLICGNMLNASSVSLEKDTIKAWAKFWTVSVSAFIPITVLWQRGSFHMNRMIVMMYLRYWELSNPIRWTSLKSWIREWRRHTIRLLSVKRTSDAWGLVWLRRCFESACSGRYTDWIHYNHIHKSCPLLQYQLWYGHWRNVPYFGHHMTNNWLSTEGLVVCK